MSALSSRQVAIDKRRLEAVDELWEAHLSLAPARALLSWLAVIKFEGAAEITERNPDFRKIFETLGSNCDIKSLSTLGAQKTRPWVTPMAWATYSASMTVAFHAAMRWQILKGGYGKQDFADYQAMNKLLKTVLPHQSIYIDEHGPSGYPYLVQELEDKLLRELQAMLAATDIDRSNLEQAAEILKQSNQILSQTASAQQGAEAGNPPAT